MSDPTVEDGSGGQKVSGSKEKEEVQTKSGLCGAKARDFSLALLLFLDGYRKKNCLFQELKVGLLGEERGEK